MPPQLKLFGRHVKRHRLIDVRQPELAKQHVGFRNNELTKLVAHRRTTVTAAARLMKHERTVLLREREKQAERRPGERNPWLLLTGHGDTRCEGDVSHRIA